MLRPKHFKLVWWCLQFLSGFLAKGHLSLVSRQSRLSVNYMGDNEIIPGAVLLAFILQLIKNRKCPARRPSMKAMGPVITSSGVSYLQMSSVGSHSRSGMEEKGKKESLS